MNNDTGILVTNIGSPSAPTPLAIRAYLSKFLSDKRVVELPKWLWYPLLYGIILPFRSRSSAKLYKKIWTSEGSPLTVNSQQLKRKLQLQLKCPVELGMHYGNPSLAEALTSLMKQNVKQIIFLPLFPQYSATTTASSFDIFTKALQSYRDIPSIRFIKDYADDACYIDALCKSIQKTWEKRGQAQHLLFSFHGIPERCINLGDPYLKRCNLTAQLVAERLKIKKDFWSIAFQSRLGRAKWLTPYTDKILTELPTKGITRLQVISPGFAVDCLETLEELAIRGQEQFLEAGGKDFYYIPALNVSENHIQALASLITQST